ncbi:hypothetical protein K469DRAFT_389765 [Zopfia rhizophila CBS 207.26]|uniref:Uncharacterized protein n=1 Tax=Zopfia rhizophila CBS 207.26 TaxID=1314779 RepID=A0A6A6EL70_9PEZI|nr:hypothetical protein K469DRAFT_389765 [Zopfia rhizophila CBS 207.26]
METSFASSLTVNLSTSSSLTASPRSPPAATANDEEASKVAGLPSISPAGTFKPRCHIPLPRTKPQTLKHPAQQTSRQITTVENTKLDTRSRSPSPTSTCYSNSPKSPPRPQNLLLLLPLRQLLALIAPRHHGPCPFLHSLPPGVHEVSYPPTAKHYERCSLPLCPIQL